MQENHGIHSRIIYAKNVCCTVFSVIITGMYALGALFSKNATFVPTPRSAMLLLLFSAVIGASALLISGESVRGWQYALHFVLSSLSFYLCVILPTGIAKFGGTSIVLLVCFFAIYGVCILARYLIRRRRARASEALPKYTSIFDRNSDV